MKHKGNNSITHVYRDKELISKYYEIRKEMPFPINNISICNRLSNTPTSKFYISEESAYAYVIKRTSKGHIRLKSNKELLYNAFYAHYIKAKMDMVNKTMYEIIREVLNRPAPSFGLSSFRIRSILSKHGIK